MVTVGFDKITPSLGANVRVSAKDATKEGVAQQILEGLNTYGVLVFPQINLPDEDFLTLTGQLGDMEAATVTADGSGPSKKGIYRISADKEDVNHQDYVRGNDYWHMDGTSYAVPGKGTLLKCEHPPSEGGDTGFANLFAAYDALPEDRKAAIDDLTVIHCLEAVTRRFYDTITEADRERWNNTFPFTEQPLVWKQKSGRTSLIIGATAWGIKGMSDEEGRALLDELLEWCTRDEFTYRHRWQKGDLVIFNNPGLLHKSYPYNAASGRVMHRTTLKGYESTAA